MPLGMGPADLFKLIVAEKWVQIREHDVDLTGKIGDTTFELRGKAYLDLRIGNELKDPEKVG